MDFFRANKRFFQTIGIISLLALLYIFFIAPPADFPAGQTVKIRQGSSLRGVSLTLSEAHAIRSRLIFEASIIIFGEEKHVVGGNYFFERKLSVFSVARRIAEGKHNVAPISVTIPEGFDSEQIGELFSVKLENFDRDAFLLEAREREGYLFPDTYFFSVSDDEQNVLSYLSRNFEEKVAPLRADIAVSGRTEADIIIMASIIEGEAKGEGDRDFISGILWKRLDKSIPLQVDVAPETYKARGLPERPISNPGLNAIKAAIFPEKSSYLYYLHDKEGGIHYARTFEEHRQNIAKYLK